MVWNIKTALAMRTKTRCRVAVDLLLVVATSICLTVIACESNDIFEPNRRHPGEAGSFENVVFSILCVVVLSVFFMTTVITIRIKSNSELTVDQSVNSRHSVAAAAADERVDVFQKLVVAAACVFCVCHIPVIGAYGLLLIFKDHYKLLVDNGNFVVVFFSATFDSTINLVIYAAVAKKFRSALKRLFGTLVASTSHLVGNWRQIFFKKYGNTATENNITLYVAHYQHIRTISSVSVSGS